MAVRDTKLIRAKNLFIEEVLDKIIKIEEARGRSKTGYPEATEILRQKINALGGIREFWLW